MTALNEIEGFLKENLSITDSLYSSEFNSIITQEKLEDYLLEVKEVLLKYSISTATRKKCYGILVEALENVMRHGSKEENYNLVFHKFVIGKDSLELCFGNYVAKDDVPNLKKHIKLIELKITENIKELMYTKASDGESLSDKGGAGIGIFDMALKSKGKMKHAFIEIHTRDYFLTLITII